MPKKKLIQSWGIPFFDSKLPSMSKIPPDALASRKQEAAFKSKFPDVPYAMRREENGELRATLKGLLAAYKRATKK